jgi:chromatin segregation and condensation protein Rec8/ScpA/Scc1 (kleisin family)
MLLESLAKANLLEVSLSKVLQKLEENYLTNPKGYFTLLFLESLIFLSLALYRKSELILRIYFPQGEEEGQEEDKPSESLPLDFRKEFSLTLPMGRLLEEKVFLPRIEGVEIEEEGLTLAHLIEPMLKILEREKSKRVFEVEIPDIDISFYLERVEGLILSWGKATFRRMLEQFERGILTVVYLFLAILFLAFEGKIRVFPLDDDLEILLHQS